MGFFKTDTDIDRPFASYEEYTSYIFSCVDRQIHVYLDELKGIFAAGQGGFKNVLYPDIEIASDLTSKHLSDFFSRDIPDSQDASDSQDSPDADAVSETAEEPTEDSENESDGDLLDLFGDFAAEEESYSGGIDVDTEQPVTELMAYIRARAELNDDDKVFMPLHRLCKKGNFSDFTIFCFACAILSSTQTNYASVFQIIGQNGNLSAPTFETAARVYFGKRFSITTASAHMSEALEKLKPLFDLRINGAMPFSTQISPDKRLIDYLFGTNPKQLDEDYSRFLKLVTNDEELHPIIANSGQLDAIGIAYDDHCRLFSLYGDEGSGRKFTIRHFCALRTIECVGIDCGKLFSYDFSFVEKALWAVNRECILLDACCCLDNLSYREDEKEKFFGYMDLAFGKLLAGGITVFALSREKLPVKEMTSIEYTQLELPTPNNGEREELWAYYADGYEFEDDVDLNEMAT
jgi:hypothetical protein